MTAFFTITLFFFMLMCTSNFGFHACEAFNAKDWGKFAFNVFFGMIAANFMLTLVSPYVNL